MKVRLIILMENIEEKNRALINLDEFKITKYLDSLSFKKFQYFLSRVLQLQINEQINLRKIGFQ